jgi:gamma-glutamylputrescine oxidase
MTVRPRGLLQMADERDVGVWSAEAQPVRSAPALRGRLTTDILIVGGGLTGVSAALHLRETQPSAGITLLEGSSLGSGASGRNGGQVLNWINGVSPAAAEDLRRIHDVTRAGIEIAEELARRHAPGSFARSGAVEILTDVRRAEHAHAHVEKLQAAGIAAEYVPASALSMHGAAGGILDPLAGRLNGFALLQALRPVLIERGIALHERTPVRRIRTGREIAARCDGGEVRARALVIATNAWSPALGFFRGGLLPLHSHVLATAPLASARWNELGFERFAAFSDDLDRITYACRTHGDRLLLGGGGNAAYTYRFGGALDPGERARLRALAFLRARLARYFPDLARTPIEHSWSGPLAITLDRVCSMGVSGSARNVFHAVGYSGHGIALALLAGRVIADLYRGHHEPWRDLPFYQRRLLPIPPEPLRWLGYQAYTRLTGRTPRRKR